MNLTDFFSQYNWSFNPFSLLQKANASDQGPFFLSSQINFHHNLQSFPIPQLLNQLDNSGPPPADVSKIDSLPIHEITQEELGIFFNTSLLYLINNEIFFFLIFQFSLIMKLLLLQWHHIIHSTSLSSSKRF